MSGLNEKKIYHNLFLSAARRGGVMGLFLLLVLLTPSLQRGDPKSTEPEPFKRFSFFSTASRHRAEATVLMRRAQDLMIHAVPIHRYWDFPRHRCGVLRLPPRSEIGQSYGC